MGNKKKEIKTGLLNKEEVWTWKKQGQNTVGGTDYNKELITVHCVENMKRVHSVVKMPSF